MRSVKADSSGLSFRHFGFDGRRQSVNTFQIFLVEGSLHELDAEMSFNFHHELEHVDGIDFQLSAEQRLVVAQVCGSHVGNPQTAQYNGLKLFLNARHIVGQENRSIP